LDWPLRNTAHFLKSWSGRHIGNFRIHLEISKEVVHRLEAARDRQPLLVHEEQLRRELKMKSLALLSLLRTIARQESCILWLREGDTPTQFFHIHANTRRRKKFIRLLRHDRHTMVGEGVKAEALYDFFNVIIGTLSQR
jgi:hypothetical protein